MERKNNSDIKNDMEKSFQAKKQGKEFPAGQVSTPSDSLLQEPSAAKAYVEEAKKGHLKRKNREEPERAGEVPFFRDPRIPAGGGHTEEEYFALPDDLRVELIDGVFYAMASPLRLHQRVAFEIARQLADCIEDHDLPCFVYIAPSDVALGDDKKTIVQPDVYVHCDMEKDKGNGPFRGAPDFAVEVLSPSNPENDLWRKRELYKRHGIREYWIINPRNCKVYVFIFENCGQDDPAPEEHTFDDHVPVHISKGKCEVNFPKIYQKIKHFLE